MHADTRPQTPPRRSFPLPLVHAQTVKLQEQKEMCVLGQGGERGWSGGRERARGKVAKRTPSSRLNLSKGISKQELVSSAQLLGSQPGSWS